MSDFEICVLAAGALAAFFYAVGYYDGSRILQPIGAHCKCFSCRKENRK